MSAQEIRSALGQLQDDPENEQAYGQLREAVANGEVADMSRDDLRRILGSARHAHEGRREYDAAASLLELELMVAQGTPDEAKLLSDLARMCEEELFDDTRAAKIYERIRALSPDDGVSEEALERIAAKRSKWNELVVRYIEEANAAGEPAFKASLLVSAAEVAYRYGRPALQGSGEKGAKKKLTALTNETVQRLEEAFQMDPRSRRAGALLERLYREQKKYEELAALLEKGATEATAKEEKTAGFVRLARVLTKKLKSPERAVAAYERVLDLAPGHPEATSALVDFFTARELWDHLVSLYDEQLASSTRAGHPDPGITIQLAMVHWRMRGKPDAAEPYFEKLRKLEPAHPGMLGFFREYLVAKGDTARLAQILSDAQRTMPDGPARSQIATELAKLAEEGANASKAIEQWRALLRQDPANREARDALKRLYRQAEGWAALGDLLRGELEKIPADDAAGRLPVLREIAALYREHLKNDAALVSVLTQISTLDPHDTETVRDLVRVYDALGRTRDLLVAQTRLAELETNSGTRAELYRQVARRYLEQFSNVQNATEAYEKLLEVAPSDTEANEKLKELYLKRRAYKPLYDLLEREAAAQEGAARRDTWLEMAKIAAERLDRGADAVTLYKRILEEDKTAIAALDALEKQAERDKDFTTVAEALERRLEITEGEQGKLAVLQKLGVLYSERLHDPQATVRTFRRVLSVSPGNAKALRVLRDAYLSVGDYDGLETLFAESQDWEGLADVLSNAADRATDSAAKIDLSFRAADVYVAKLKAPDRAFRAYERILSVRPDDAKAATALIPLYEKEERWARLPALYEVLLGHAEKANEKLHILEKLGNLTAEKLQDGAASFRYAQRAYELAPESPEVSQRLEAAAQRSHEWVAYVAALEARQAAATDKVEKRNLRAKIAEISAGQLGQVDEAVASYRALVEQDEHDEDAMAALDRILRAADRREDLRWLYELRVERANTAQKLELLNEWATLEEEAFGAADRAVVLYKRVLDIVPQHGRALRALSRLLQTTGDSGEAAAMLERDRDQREGKERASRELELAKLYAGSLGRPNDALEATKRALDLVPGDPSAIAQLEELLGVAQTRARVAGVLEGLYAASGDGVKQAQVIEVLLATAAAKADRLSLYERLLDVHERLGALETAFDVAVRGCSDFPGELAMWDRLSVLANKTQRTPAFVETLAVALPLDGPSGLPAAVEADLAERAATLYDELGDIDKARPYLERVLRVDPSNERAFARLKQILTSLERWADLEALYERTVAAAEGSRKSDLLAEVALLAEEIIGDRSKAMEYYERILGIEATHEQAIRALDTLYASEGKWDRLAKLLERRLENAAGSAATALRLRLGALWATRLADGGRALEYLDTVLQMDPASHEARDLVEKCLEQPELRARAAVILEAVYVSQDAPRDLVRVLEIRLESAANDEERAELLRRVAELRDDRLNEDVAALDTFARLVPIAPDDAHARERLLDIARRVGSHEQAADVLLKAAKNARAPQPRGEILAQVARIYEDLLGDSVRAETVYREVLELDPEDATLTLPAARALERIYAATARPAELAQMLRVQVKLEDDAEAKKELRARLGDLCETSLDDRAGAIAAWRARVDDDASDERALAALDRLYERGAEWRALVDVLRAREGLTTDGAERKALMLRLAQTLSDRLSDVLEAITAYRAVVDDFGAERSVLSALANLYEVADKWPDLVETLEAELGMAEETVDRLVLLARIGEVRRARLADVPGAIEAYRQALTLDTSHADSRAALEALLEDPNARREAAEILRPLYETDGEHAKLLRVLDIAAQFADSPTDKLALFAQAAMVAEQSLGDAARAFEYAARGVKEAAAEPELSQWLERAERLAATTGKYKDLLELLRAVVPEVLDENLQLDVTLKIAELAEARLADVTLARTYYEKALAIRDTDARALSALERLYDALGDHVALRSVLERRAENETDNTERKAYLYKLARLCDERLSDARAAIETYERILDVDLEDAALTALEGLYTKAERWDDLVALYERQIGANPSTEKKASLHHALGGVFEKRLSDHERAFGEFEAALKLDAQHAGTVASLEGLMGNPEHAARAAEMLESVYLARLDWRSVMGTLEARLGVSQDPDERRTLLRRLAKLHEEQEENYLSALETTAKLLTEDVTDETTWHELERLARVANAEKRLAEIFEGALDKVTAEEASTAALAKRTGELFESQKDTERALKFYRRAYAFAPEDSEGVFEAIDRLLREANRPRDRVTLYRDALQYRDEPSMRLTTLHTIALLEETELSDDDAAIDTYRAALDLDETDGHSLEALARLYGRRERWRDLADLTRRRAEQAALPEEEARFRFELGQLLETRLGEVGQAIDEYQAVVEVMPPGSGAQASTDAVHALEALLQKDEHKARVVDILRPIYERTDDWRHLVGVNDERLRLATDPTDKVAILRETAGLWEQRGQDRDKAFDAMREAFVLDPEDGESRGELDRLAEATKRWDDLADAYEKGIAKTEDFGQRDLLAALAKLHDAKRDDPRRALEAYERLYAKDETDIGPLEQMDALATLLSDWPALVRVLAKKAELLPNDEDRSSTWRRIAEARRDMLDDAPGAIEAYERALELEPDSAWTLDNLIPLYEAKNDAAKLVDLYRRRIDLCGEDDGGLKHQLLLDAAARYEGSLNDRREAIALLSEALTTKPGDPDVTERLSVLYAAERMWPELLENLRLQAAGTEDPSIRRNVKKRIGALLAHELEDARSALDAYREVLEGGFDEESAKAVREIGESREELRSEAADALEPVLRAGGRNDELADVLEMRLRAQTDPADRAKTLRAIATVAEGPLGNATRAHDALLRALAEEPHDAEVHQEIERLSVVLGDAAWARYADALAERAGAIFDATVAADLFSRLGRVAEEHLKDDARAAKAYVAASEQAGDGPEVLAALDRLYGRLGDAKSLAEVLERRAAVEAEPAAQVELNFRLASLQIKEFGERAKGLSTLRNGLERVPDHEPSRQAVDSLLDDEGLFAEAFETLETVYRALGKNAELGTLYERRVTRARDPREKNRARLELARVLDEQVHDPARAQRAVEAALLDDPADPDALAELERLAPVTNGWREASDALAKALSGDADVPSGVRSELWVRLAAWRRDKLSDARGAEDAFVEARKLDPESTDILRSIEDLQRAPGRERDLVTTLRARAKAEVDLSTKKQLLREAKTLAEGTLTDRALAEGVLRDVLAEDEGDLWALEELTNLREEAGAYDEVATLLLRRAELEVDGAAVAQLRHRAAGTMREKLADLPRATALYEEIFEAEPTDEKASSALRELYETSGKRKELVRLLERLIDVAEAPEARATLRVELSRVKDAMGDTREAIETLRAVLEENRAHQEATLALSALLEKSGMDEELAELLNGQIEEARERGDTASELALNVRLGEVFEKRLQDVTRALATYEAVLSRDANHPAALEAVARLSEGRSSWERAASALTQLLALTTDAPAGVSLSLRLAKAKDAQGDVEGVEAALRSALKFERTNDEVRSQLRSLLEKGKKWAELAELVTEDASLLEDALPPEAERTPALVAPVVKGLRKAADLHLTQRKAPGEAVPLLERASALAPQDRELLLLLCDAYTASGRERAAADALEKVIASYGGKRSKELAGVHHRLGRALAGLGERDTALAQYDMAFKIDPGNVPVLRDLGIMAMETGDLDRAQKTFRALLLQKLDPASGLSKGEVFFYLGEITFKQGDKPKAIQMFERALENEPGLEKAKAKLAELKG